MPITLRDWLPNLPWDGPPVPRWMVDSWDEFWAVRKREAADIQNELSAGGTPVVLPDLLYLTFKSISSAAADWAFAPGTLAKWVAVLDQQVAREGKFTQLAVFYKDISPPPFLYDYKCRKCLPTGERISTEQGMIPIEAVQVGTRVLSHDGRFHLVVAKGMRSYDGDMYLVKPKGGIEFWTTPDHLVLTGRDWEETQGLKAKDDLLIPIPSETFNIDYVPVNLGLGLKGYLKVTTGLLRLMGYYAAEGHFAGRMISFSFNSEKDQQLVEDVSSITRELLPDDKIIRLYRPARCKCINVIVNSVPLGLWLTAECGHLAPNKRFPHWAMVLSPKLQEELIKSAWRGDG